MNDLFIKVSLDNESILGKVANMKCLAEELYKVARDIERSIEFEEEKPAESIGDSAGENN